MAGNSPIGRKKLSVDLRFYKSTCNRFAHLALFFILFFLSSALSADKGGSTVKFGVFESYPLISRGDDGNGGSLFTDVIESIGHEEGWKIEYVYGTFAECIERVKNGEIDLIGPAMPIKEREAFLDFTENSVLNIWGQVYVRVDSEINTIIDLEGKTVGVFKGGANGTNFMKLAKKFEISCDFRDYATTKQVVDALLSEEVDAVAIVNFSGYKYEQEGVLKQTGVIFNPTPVKFATAKGTNGHLIKAIDSRLSKWKSESKSEYYRILGKWFSLSEKEVLPGWVVKVISFVVMVLLVVVAFVFILRHQMKVRTDELLRSREQRKRIVDSLIETFLCRHDVEGVFNYVSPSVSQVLGYSTNEFLTHFTKYLTDDPINQEAIKHTEESIKGVQQPSFEMQMFHKDQSVRWLQVSETPVIDKDGKVIAVEGVAHDITDRKLSEVELRQSEESLRKSQHLLNSTIDNSPAVIYIKDTQGCYLMINNRYEELMEMSRQDILGKTDMDLYPKEIADEFIKIDQSILRSNTSLEIEEVALHANGELHTYISNKFPLQNDDGTPYAICGISMDITERKEAADELFAKGEQLKASNQQLRANEKEREGLVKTLEFKNKELQDIVYTASHDLKSPLVNISGFSGHLGMTCESLLKFSESIKEESSQQKIKDAIKNEVPEAIGYITSSVEKMKSLIDGLLRISRIGTVEINIAPVDMNGLIGDVRGAMEFQLQENSTRFSVGELPSCSGDAGLLNQVFTNLIDNALKYREPSRDMVIEVSGVIEGDEVVYCVKDNGRGVEKGHQGKVFEIFHRLNPSEDVDGEGLGLTIVTRIIDRLGGRIWLESEHGVGSSFFVALPKE